MRVRYDGTLPFRADDSGRSHARGLMSISDQDDNARSTFLDKAAVLLRAAVIAPMLLNSAPAFADALDTAFVNAMTPYVVLKRGALECDKPVGEYIAYKSRMIGILGRLPNVDLIAADREIERAFEREAPMSARPTCSDALLERYQLTLDTSAEAALDYLAETVGQRLRGN
ncbi:hypothetical protein ACO34A_21750 [Rhizobium sp. ACO-34A]|nr:hypothetical protein ACO34A_21750 [Rhizobium sp. ACO-34A]